MRFSAAIKSIEPVIVKMRMRMFCVSVSIGLIFSVRSPSLSNFGRIASTILRRVSFGVSTTIFARCLWVSWERRSGPVAEAYIHGGVFGEGDLLAASEEVCVDRAASAVGAHEK